MKLLKAFQFQTVISIELKFGMHVLSHHRTNLIGFDEFRMNSFFTGVKKKRIFIHYGLWSQINIRVRENKRIFC